MKKEITFDSFIRALMTIAVLFFAYFLIDKLSNVLIPFLIAWFIAYMLYPIVCFFQYKCKLKNRIISIITTLVIIVGSTSISIKLIIPPVMEELIRLKDIVTNYVNTQTETGTIAYEIGQYIKKNINLEKIYDSFSFQDITAFLDERIPQLLSIVSSSVGALIGFICSLISIFYLFFILKDYEKMSNGMVRLIPKNKRNFIIGIFRDVKNGMNKYFRGQSLIALIVGILFSIGFVIIDFPLAIPLGLFIGMLNLVPYLQVVGFIPTIILALLKAHDTGSNFWLIMLAALAVFVIVQIIQDGYLVPRIMGRMTGLNAAVILLSLSIWGTLLGFIGLIIALPLTTIIVSYYKRFILNANGSTEQNNSLTSN